MLKNPLWAIWSKWSETQKNIGLKKIYENASIAWSCHTDFQFLCVGGNVGSDLMKYSLTCRNFKTWSFKQYRDANFLQM